MLPRVLARYELIEEVGKGGMSVVYRGLDTTLNREVAVKVLHEYLAGEEETRRRFQREAHAVAKLRHPNILEIFDYSGLDAPESYIVTEFIHGRTLKHFLAEHPIPVPEVAAMIVAQICRAVHHAHSGGVIHRDIKPENIMIRSDGVLKLMDFGIAQIVDFQRLTVTGQLLGSPAYMAPEQIDGRPQDVRTDVFSLGTLLYELGTGELPFSGKNAHEILKRIAEGAFADPEIVRPAIGDSLARILRRAMAHRPEDRFPDVAALMDALQSHLVEAGFPEPDGELGRFFAEPAAYSADARRRLVERLLALGRERLRAGQTAKALGLLNRVLALSPDRREVHELLDRLARRRRLGRTAGALALIVLMSGAVYAGIRALPLVRPPAPIVVAPREVPSSPRTPAAAPEVRIPPAPAARAAPVTEVEIVPFPTKSVDMMLDGVPIGSYGQRKTVRVGPKAHRLKLHNPLCEDAVLEIPPDETRAQIPVRLTCRGRVLVRCDALDAVVHVGDVRGRCNQEIQVSPGRKTLRVEAAGFAPYEGPITVEPISPLAERRVELHR
jgi:eukaryotic-like serine/threonine-protein kinase